MRLTISNDIVSTKIYDKRDDFDFEIINFPLLDGGVPRSTSYKGYISQLIRFARASSHVADFNTRNKLLTQNFFNKVKGIINFAKPFQNFIDDTMIRYLNSWCLVVVVLLFLAVSWLCLQFVIVVLPDHTHYILDLNLSCAKDFWNLNGDLVYKLKKIFGSNNFPAQFIKKFPIIKRLAITLMYCNRLHAWWLTQLWLATFLFSLVARWWVGLQTQ